MSLSFCTELLFQRSRNVCLGSLYAQQAWGGWQTKKLAKFLCKSCTGCVPTDQVEDLKGCGLWLVFETTET